MVKRKTTGGGRKRKMVRGAGWFDDVKKFAGKANQVLRDTGAISNLSGMALKSGLISDPRALSVLGGVNSVSGALGYGRHEYPVVRGRGRVGDVRM